MSYKDLHNMAHDGNSEKLLNLMMRQKDYIYLTNHWNLDRDRWSKYIKCWYFRGKILNSKKHDYNINYENIKSTEVWFP